MMHEIPTFHTGTCPEDRPYVMSLMNDLSASEHPVDETFVEKVHRILDVESMTCGLMGQEAIVRHEILTFEPGN